MINYIWEFIFNKKTASGSIQTALKNSYLFSQLNSRELRFVEKIVHIRQYRASEIVFRQGEIGVGMYIIAKGSIDIFQERGENSSEGEEEQVHITRLSEGTFFGELSLVEENGCRSATACAQEDSTLIGFFKPDLLEVLERNPVIGVKITFKLAEILGQRLRATTEKVSQLRSHIRSNTAPREMSAQ